MIIFHCLHDTAAVNISSYRLAHALHIMMLRYFSTTIRYSVDFDLKKIVDESALDAKANRIEAKKQVKKVFEEKYKNQSVKTDRKAAGVSYFFNKLRF